MKNYLKTFDFLTDEDIVLFESKIKQKTIKKGEFFIQEEKTCAEVAFIVSGAFRSFYYSSNEEEVTYCFSFANSFVSAYSSFLAQTKTQENIQALTDCDLLCISKADIVALEHASINWIKFSKLVAEEQYMKLEKRVFQLQKETADKRYADLVQNEPELLQLIPLNFLSSYLGITQRHLSRIRKSIAN